MTDHRIPVFALGGSSERLTDIVGMAHYADGVITIELTEVSKTFFDSYENGPRSFTLNAEGIATTKTHGLRENLPWVKRARRKK